MNEINYEIASDQLRDDTFMNNYKKLCFKKSVDVAKDVLKCHIKQILSSLSITSHEFCQILNYDVNLIDFFWQNFEKFDTIESLVSCFDAKTDEDYAE